MFTVVVLDAAVREMAKLEWVLAGGREGQWNRGGDISSAKRYYIGSLLLPIIIIGTNKDKKTRGTSFLVSEALGHS